MSGRADALRALMRRVEMGTGSPAAATTVLALGRRDATHLFWEVVNNDSLNAVARLEAPLRERRWWGPNLSAPDDDFDVFDAMWRLRKGPLREGPDAIGKAPTEARARLLAVLRAMLHEESSS